MKRWEQLKSFLLGLLLIPALVGAVVIWHVFIDTKRDLSGEEITNRIARAELAWLAMNKPKLFCRTFEWVCEDVEEQHERRQP